MEKPISTHAVKAVIKNELGEILFLQRDGSARADGKSNWDLPGGLVEPGEQDRIALEREVEEELQCQAKVGHKLGKWNFYRPFDKQTVEVTNYQVTLDTTNIEDLTLSDEHLGVKWINDEELSDLAVKDPSLLAALTPR